MYAEVRRTPYINPKWTTGEKSLEVLWVICVLIIDRGYARLLVACHLVVYDMEVVIARNFAQSLRGSWGSSQLSFMSFGHTNVEICNTSSLERNLQEVLFGISKFF